MRTLRAWFFRLAGLFNKEQHDRESRTLRKTRSSEEPSTKSLASANHLLRVATS